MPGSTHAHASPQAVRPPLVKPLAASSGRSTKSSHVHAHPHGAPSASHHTHGAPSSSHHAHHTQHAPPPQQQGNVTAARMSLVMSLAPGQYTPSARCPLFDNGTRFGCALADPSFHPYRTADRDTAAGSAAGAVAAAAVQEGASARTVRLDTARPFNPARLASLLRGATLYLIGDSLTEQHARGTACALGVAAVVPTAIWAAQCWGRGKRPPVGEPVGIDDDGPRVCFVQAGKGIADRSTRAAYDEVVTSEGMRRGSVFVVNEGLWFRVGRPAGQGEATAEVEEARARLWADVPYESLRASHGVYFFWRETAAQHFATADGLWQVRPGLGSERLPQTACRPLDATAGAVQTRLSERVRAAVPPGMRLLPLFAASQAAWRAHIERHTEHGRKVRGTDCTHFCEPCALFDDVNGRLVEALERAGASRRA